MITRRMALTAAVLGFFVLAGVGWSGGVPVDACAMRAGIGMVVVYVMARVLNWVLVQAVADAVVRAASEKEEGSTDAAREEES